MYPNQQSKHKVFVSYYHKDDQYYRDEFERMFGNVFISKSVHPGDINDDLSTDYIKRLIREDYITDASVVVVLVGSNAWRRKHVDWEIYAGLSKMAGGYSGLVGILLPSFPTSGGRSYDTDNLPPRLADNVLSKYAKVYSWSDVCSSGFITRSAIEVAFRRRIDKSHLIKNGREQFDRNR